MASSDASVHLRCNLSRLYRGRTTSASTSPKDCRSVTWPRIRPMPNTQTRWRSPTTRRTTRWLAFTAIEVSICGTSTTSARYFLSFLFFFLILLRLSWVNHSPSHLFIWLFSFSLKLFHFFLIKMYIIGWQIAFVFVSRCVHLGRRIVPLFQRRHEGRSAHWLVRDLLE